MTGTTRWTVLDLFRLAPAETFIFTVVPLVLALGQLTNSALTGVPFYVSIPFALVMVGYAGIHTFYRLARVRREEIERAYLDPI